MYSFYSQDEKLTQIHQTSMKILAEVGMKFHHPEIVEIVKSNGVRVEGNVAYFTEEEILEWVAKAPRIFTLYARNEKYNMTIGGDNVYVCPGIGASNVSDIAGNKRRGTLDDYKKFLKLYHQNPDFYINGGLLIQPAELEKSVPALLQYLSILYSDKCMNGVSGDTKEAKEMLDVVAAAFGGKDAIMRKPRIIKVVSTNTPLQLDYKMSETLLQFAAYRQPVIIAAAAMAGTTSPITLAGTLALANAEIIATIAVSQMIAPGMPVVYGSQTCSADLKTGQIAIGSPEGALCYQYTAKLGKAYGIPCRGGGALTDSKVLNAQAGNETMMTLMAAAGAKMNLIFQCAGIMDGYNSISFEKLALDFEVIRMVKRYLGDITVDETSLAFDAIKERGIAGEYMTANHTFENIRRETYIPDLAVRGSVSEDPAKVYNDHIAAKLDTMLAQYERPAISEEQINAMQAVLEEIGFDREYLAELAK